MSESIRPISVEGKTTAVNATTSDTAAAIAVSGTVAIIGVGAEPICIRFARETDAAVTTTTGFRLPANSVVRMTISSGSTFLQHIRAGASNSTISVLWAEGGV